MYELVEKMCSIGRRAYARQLVAGTEGNFSARIDAERILCTPTMCCKGLLTPLHLCVVDLTGNRLMGRLLPSSEISMHLAAYQASSDIGAVVHAHPPCATTFALLGESIPAGILPEGEIFLGDVPVVPYAMTGTPEMGAALQPFLMHHVAAILQNHGAVTWGPDLETAYVLMETLEAVCRVVIQARQVGEPRRIPSERLAELTSLRNRLRGVHREARRS